MAENETKGFIDFFNGIPDHRIDRQKRYSVAEVMLIAFCGVLAGCDSWNDLELFGKTKLPILRTYLPYEFGAPSDDTLRRFFRALDADKFESCFVEWVKSFQLDLTDKVVAIDGKTSRRSFDGDNKAMHMVSAFVTELGLTLGQLKTDKKSNEITAIPQLLEFLDLNDAIVTIDAMGCQTKVVESILEQGADYLISLKGNQGNLCQDVQLFFESPPKGADMEEAMSQEKGHGRLEKRRCCVTDKVDWLKDSHPHWKGLNSIIELTSERIIKGKCTTEKRYYISSLSASSEKLLSATREHWGVENKLHLVLDIVFNDDQSRIRKGNAPRNMAIIKKTVLNLLQIIKRKRPRTSFKGMRKMAGWYNDFLHEVLIAEF